MPEDIKKRIVLALVKNGLVSEEEARKQFPEFFEDEDKKKGERR